MDIGTLDDETTIKILLEAIRSNDDVRKKQALSFIPMIILHSLSSKKEIMEQLLLVIYNLNTSEDNFEYINIGNRPIVYRHLLRLFREKIQAYNDSHVDALAKIVKQVDTPELLTELAYAIFRCSDSTDTDLHVKEIVLNAFREIQEKANAKLYPDVLLMIHSINALKQYRL